MIRCVPRGTFSKRIAPCVRGCITRIEWAELDEKCVAGSAFGDGFTAETGKFGQNREDWSGGALRLRFISFSDWIKIKSSIFFSIQIKSVLWYFGSKIVLWCGFRRINHGFWFAIPIWFRSNGFWTERDTGIICGDSWILGLWRDLVERLQCDTGRVFCVYLVCWLNDTWKMKMCCWCKVFSVEYLHAWVCVFVFTYFGECVCMMLYRLDVVV